MFSLHSPSDYSTVDDYEKIYEKLKFIIIFRPLAFSVIILAYIFIRFNNIYIYKNFIYFLIIAVICLSFLYFGILQYFKKRENLKLLEYFGFIQLFIDFTLIFIIVLFNGGLNSRLIFLYYLLVLIGGFIFLRLGALVFSVASSIAIGLLADLQYYFNFRHHLFFLSNPDKLLFLTSINILGVLIFGSLLYHFSGGIRILSKKIIERDEFIKNSQNFSRELINSFSQGVIVLDNNHIIVFMNKAATQILNLDHFNQIFLNKAGVLFNFNLGIRDILDNFPTIILNGGNEKYDNTRHENKNSEPKRFEIKHQGKILGFAYTEFVNCEGFPGKFMLLFRDITFIKQVEMESKINEGLMTAGRFAGWLAHEVRNPLFAINTSANILNSQNLDCNSEDYKKLMGIIKTEALRLDNLVNDFLGFAKIKSKNISCNKDSYENFNLFTMVNDLISQFHDEPQAAINRSSKNNSNDKIKINIYNRINPNTAIFSEKYRIRQVFVNILQNAIQSIQKNGIKNKAGLIRFGSKIIKNGDGEKRLLVCLADNGEGMDDFTLKNVFKPLFTTKENGFGLGLSIVHSILENLDGKIKIESRINKGTLIKISLPF